MRPTRAALLLLVLGAAGCGGRSALLSGQDGASRGDRTRRHDLGGDHVRRPDGGRDLARPREARFDRSCASYSIEAEDGSQVSAPGWLVFSGGVLHGGKGLESSSAGSKLTWSFEGTGLTVYYEGGPNRGTFAVSVDGQPSVVVVTKAPSFVFQVPAVVASGLPFGTHSATLVCQTQICSVDYFFVVGC